MISGKTTLIAHIGYPTEAFKAPLIYNPWFEHAGIDAVVVPMGCKAEDYPAFLKSLSKLTNLHGALITMPHKVDDRGACRRRDHDGQDRRLRRTPFSSVPTARCSRTCSMAPDSRAVWRARDFRFERSEMPRRRRGWRRLGNCGVACCGGVAGDCAIRHPRRRRRADLPAGCANTILRSTSRSEATIPRATISWSMQRLSE